MLTNTYLTALFFPQCCHLFSSTVFKLWTDSKVNPAHWSKEFKTKAEALLLLKPEYIFISCQRGVGEGTHRHDGSMYEKKSISLSTKLHSTTQLTHLRTKCILNESASSVFGFSYISAKFNATRCFCTFAFCAKPIWNHTDR